ncbi:MAG: hypothetical protein JXB36_21065 [Gammaproteobacteria bacterium]|nr:hypothetical protein [Gammaproteobacteria bacterium]
MDEKTIERARVVLSVPGSESVILRRDIVYLRSDAGEQTLDIRYPPVSERHRQIPAVLFVAGYPDAQLEAQIGKKPKETAPLVSWAELIAASGLAAVTYTNCDPASDARAVLEHVLRNDPVLGIDPDRLGLFACSGNVPNALAMLMGPHGERLKCAVLCYGFMLDEEGDETVAAAARTWGFVNPCAGNSVDALPAGVPLFVARAGQDGIPGINASIDRFAALALAANKPVTLMNVADAPHGFDLFHDEESSREAIRCMLTFMRFHLLGK